jgi:hypothetical protein
METITKDELRRAIRQAFAGVTLGEGIGLWEAQAIDDYADDKSRQAQRLRDEREDWSRIPVESLQYADSSLSFFDAAGMRFHLPAFLLAEIDGDSNGGPLFALTNLWDEQRFALLNNDHRHVIRMFLEWCLEQHEYEYEHDQIRRALVDHWPSVNQA